MRHTLLTAAALSAVITAPAEAQTIRVAPAIEVARETDPRRWSEPHLAVHPAKPEHLLGAAWSALTAADPGQERHCAAFVSVDSGTRWTRHDFPMTACYDEQVAILPDGQAVYVALATLPGVKPDRGDWLVMFHSTDGGMTWDPTPTTLGWRFDHPSVTVDPGSPAQANWIYITSHLEWGDGTPQRKSAVFVARSRDWGQGLRRAGAGDAERASQLRGDTGRALERYARRVVRGRHLGGAESAAPSRLGRALERRGRDIRGPPARQRSVRSAAELPALLAGRRSLAGTVSRPPLLRLSAERRRIRRRLLVG